MDEHALKVGLEEKVAAVKERWWRSLAQLERADVGGEREFAEGETESALAGFDRRSFLKLMGASIALAGAGGTAGCSKPQPVEKIVPYVNQPEGMVAGVARYYASAIPIHGWGRGVVVEQHEGRPTKIEGNPDHPSSVGGTDILMQAAILELYDPDRATGVTNGGQTTTWSNFVGVLGRFVEERGGAKRVRVRVLSGTVTSPTVARQMEEMRAIFPGMVWHQHDPVGRVNTNGGMVQAFGRALTAVYDFKKATCVLSLDAHFLGDEPGAVRYSREFAHRRRVAFKRFGPTGSLVEGDGAAGRESISRLYVAESAVTFTGARADHRLPLKARDIARVAALVADSGVAMKCPEAVRAWAKAAGDDLRQAGKNALVVVGENQPAEVHALGHALNASLGAIGNTVRYIERIEAGPVGGVDSSLASLTEAMDRGEVDLLVVLDSNPVFDAPRDVRFAEALRRFSSRQDRLAVSLAAHEDETAELCRWVIPLSHALEAWGDCRGHDGTASVIQPLIEPLYESKSVVEFLAAVMAAREGQRVGQLGEGYDLVRRHWFGAWGNIPEAEKELRWRKSLHRGTVPDSAFADVQVALKGTLQMAIAKVVSLIGEEEGRIELNIRPDPSIHAGGWANNPWLQELPKPLTRLTWDNAAIVSPAMAVRLKLEGGAEGNHESRARQAMIRVSMEGRTCDLPVWVQPGQPEDAITVYLGGGRWRGGHVQEGVGFNVYPLRSSGNLWQNSEVKVEAINRTYPLACTHNHQVMDGRDIVRERAITQLPGVNAARTSPDLYSSQKDKDGSTVHLSLYDEYKYEGYKWGMVIDLSACIGCNACVVACQAENNIPVVGKEQVLQGARCIGFGSTPTTEVRKQRRWQRRGRIRR